jgi:hypothetical protein
MTIYRGVGGGGNATTDSEIALLTQLEQSATAKAAEAAASALVAEGHADDAADSATAANASKIAAANSASSASSSATAASNSASSASTSASNAASSESAAALSESAAETAQGLAEDAQTAAETAQGLAEDAQAAAEAAQAAAEDIFTQFGDQYLGAFATDPTVDNSGNALTTGDIYFNTTDNVLKFYSGAAWVAPEDVATTAATEAAASALEASGYADDASGFADTASGFADDASGFADAASSSASEAADSATAAATFDPANFVEVAGDTMTGSLGIGGNVTGVIAGVSVDSKFCVKQEGTDPVAGFVKAENTTAGSGSVTFACRSRGTLASPTVVQSGDALWNMYVAGHDGTDLALAAEIAVEVDGTPGSNDMPGRIVFKTTPDGQQAPVERMRISSAGNVGIGTSSPRNRADVYGDLTVGGSGAPRANLYRDVQMNIFTGAGSIDFGGRYDSTNYATGARVSGLTEGTAWSASGHGTALLFSTTPNNSTTLTERARIDSSGNLLVGTTGPAEARLNVRRSDAGYAISAVNTSTSGLGVASSVNANDTSTTYFDGYSQSTSNYRFRVYTNGNVVNTNNSYGPLSDIKLKENIVDATPKLDKLMQVRIVNYNLKTDPDLKQIGVIAQELEQVFPGLVDEHPDRDKEGNDLGTTTKSVKMSVFVPMLIKAIQEQQAIINDLKARLDAANL